MPRRVVPLVIKETYHVYNRGVDKRSIFLDNIDYLRFYNSIRYFNLVEPTTSLFECMRTAKRRGTRSASLVEIHAYCFLPNHFHLLLTQTAENGISEFMKRLCGGYTSYFNEKYGRSGSLLQGTFKRSHIYSNERLLYLAAYINYNNIVHNISTEEDVHRSSLPIYNGKLKSTFLNTDLINEQLNNNITFEKMALPLALQISADRNGAKNTITHPDPEFLE